MAKIRVLAISGSLKQTSTNTKYLKALALMAPPGTDIEIYEGLDELPHFNPDRDLDGEWPAVEAFRSRLREAHGIVLCTPEYAAGVPGVLKNALDWTVSSGEWLSKPTAVISASPTVNGGDKAHASLLATLSMLDARIVPNGTLTIPLAPAKIQPNGVVTDPDIASRMSALMNGMLEAIRSENGSLFE